MALSAANSPPNLGANLPPLTLCTLLLLRCVSPPRQPGARVCSAPVARDERGGAASWPCWYFAFPGVKELNFSDEEITKDQTSSLVTSRCWDSSSSPA